MGRIPDDVLAPLKAEVSVARLVQGCGVELKAQGKDLVGWCPFHDGSTPSLVVAAGSLLRQGSLLRWGIGFAESWWVAGG